MPDHEEAFRKEVLELLRGIESHLSTISGALSDASTGALPLHCVVREAASRKPLAPPK